MATPSVYFLGSFPSPDLLPELPGAGILCIGRSNVGKSSFINTFTGQPISRVSNTPGRTQLINVFALDRGATLIDLPGYGYAKHARDKRDVLEELIYKTITDKRLPIRHLLLVIDATVGLTALDQEMLNFLRSEGLPFAIIANKIDKLNQAELHACLKKLQTITTDAPIFPASCRDGRGFSQIRDYIAKLPLT